MTEQLQQGVPVLFIGNLNPTTSAVTIGHLFEQYGSVFVFQSLLLLFNFYIYNSHELLVLTL